MYSESISEIMSESNMGTAEKRASQIEAMIARFNTQLQEIKPHASKDTESTQFSDILNSVEGQNVKFRLSPGSSIPKGDIENIVKKAAHQYKVDDKLLMAVIKQESGFNPNAMSKAGAGGLMQLMPGTAKKLGVTNVLDPYQNVQGGAKHLRGLLDRYKGNVILALAAYNAGGGNVDKYGGVPPFKETQHYVKNILSNYLKRQSEGVQ